MSVPVSTAHGLSPESGDALRRRAVFFWRLGRNYDVTGDGRFAWSKPPMDASGARPVIVVLNWAQELAGRAKQPLRRQEQMADFPRIEDIPYPFLFCEALMTPSRIARRSPSSCFFRLCSTPPRRPQRRTSPANGAAFIVTTTGDRGQHGAHGRRETDRRGLDR
jgi:hypothetical protein